MMLINIFKKKIELLLTDVKSDESDSRTIDVVEEGESSLSPEDEWRLCRLIPRPVRFRSVTRRRTGLNFTRTVVSFRTLRARVLATT